MIKVFFQHLADAHIRLDIEIDLGMDLRSQLAELVQDFPQSFFFLVRLDRHQKPFMEKEIFDDFVLFENEAARLPAEMDIVKKKGYVFHAFRFLGFF